MILEKNIMVFRASGGWGDGVMTADRLPRAVKKTHVWHRAKSAKLSQFLYFLKNEHTCSVAEKEDKFITKFRHHAAIFRLKKTRD